MKPCINKNRGFLLGLLFLLAMIFLYLYNSGNTKYAVYPENFLLLKNEPIRYDELQEPIVIYEENGISRNLKLLDYGIVEVLIYYDDIGGEDKETTVEELQIIFKDEKFVTSENVSVGANKKDVEKAYKKYGIVEYTPSDIENFNLQYLQLTGERQITQKFLYVDNSKALEMDYSGLDYWGGLGALVFVFDENDKVSMIIRFAPNAGISLV